MNIIFMRHGESTNNVERVLSDREIYWSVLTENGINMVKNAVDKLPDNISKVYYSPLPRTIETAHYVYLKYPDIEYQVDNRIRERFHGKYSGKPNNEDLNNIRTKQANGDYLIRLGDYGDSRFDLEYRLINFFKDVYNDNDKSSTILIISHGSVTSFMKRLLGIETRHLKPGDLEMFNDVDFSPLWENEKKIEEIKKSNNL